MAGRAGPGRWWLAAWLALACALAPAAEPPRVSVSRDGDTYWLRLTVSSTLPLAEVHRRLTDYAHLDRLSPDITDSRVLARGADGRVRVRTHVQGCVLFFCRELTREEWVQEHSPRFIVTELDPEGSDFLGGKAVWRLRPTADGGTHIDYSAWLRPAFPIPPLIGPPLVRGRLERALRITAARLSGPPATAAAP